MQWAGVYSVRNGQCELLHRRESSLCAFTFNSFISATSVSVCTKCHPPLFTWQFLADGWKGCISARKAHPFQNSWAATARQVSLVRFGSQKSQLNSSIIFCVLSLPSVSSQRLWQCALCPQCISTLATTVLVVYTTAQWVGGYYMGLRTYLVSPHSTNIFKPKALQLYTASDNPGVMQSIVIFSYYLIPHEQSECRL